jgi:hypothetical protein
VKKQSAYNSGVSAELANERKTHVTVCDINKAMLDVGKLKAAALGLDKSGEGSTLINYYECTFAFFFIGKWCMYVKLLTYQ